MNVCTSVPETGYPIYHEIHILSTLYVTSCHLLLLSLLLGHAEVAAAVSYSVWSYPQYYRFRRGSSKSFICDNILMKRKKKKRNVSFHHHSFLVILFHFIFDLTQKEEINIYDV